MFVQVPFQTVDVTFFVLIYTFWMVVVSYCAQFNMHKSHETNFDPVALRLGKIESNW